MFLNKDIIKEIKEWDYDNEIVIKNQIQSDVNYISIESINCNDEMEEYIDMEKEYKEEEEEEQNKASKKIRIELAKKLDISVKDIKIIEVIV